MQLRQASLDLIRSVLTPAKGTLLAGVAASNFDSRQAAAEDSRKLDLEAS